MTKEAAGPKRVEVTLIKPHRHAGEKHAAGAKIRVTEPERDWLVANGVIEKPAEAPAGGKK